jgi:hypothetical protein
LYILKAQQTFGRKAHGLGERNRKAFWWKKRKAFGGKNTTTIGKETQLLAEKTQ